MTSYTSHFRKYFTMKAQLKKYFFLTTLFLPFFLSAEVETYFSPKGGFRENLLEKLDQAQKTLDIAVYHVEPRLLKKPVLKALERGVRVRISLNYGADWARADHKEIYEEFKNKKNIKIRKLAKNNHQKFVIIDGDTEQFTIINGSANWAYSADHTYDEDTLFISGSDENHLRDQFVEEFEKIWKLSSEKF
ncbi:MAG: hypothetical protein HYW47_00240 [Deltaproteobacteria bacterium]|nr:hypothetical protein [Deltaproteobacteria bacterium]